MTATAEIQPYNRSFGQASRPSAPVSQSTAIEQQRAIAEVQAAVVVAQSCPRDMASAESEMEYVCGRLDMAEQAFYQVDNRGTGPSVHLMRELARIWGNVDYGVKELHRDDEKGVSEVQAFSWDIQKNTRSSRTFINPHARMKGRGAARERVQLVDLQDIYLSNQNVGARAVRECISTILPTWFTEKAQELCRRTLEHGEGEPLQDRIEKMVVWFGQMGVSVGQLEARSKKARGAWGAQDVAQFKIAGKSIRAGEARMDDLFPPVDGQSSTADEITAAEGGEPAKKERGGANIKTAPAPPAESDVVETPPQDVPVDAGEAEEPGQGGGNEQSDGGEPSSAATPVSDSADQGPHPDAKPQNSRRAALESRLFGLIGTITPKLDDDDRITLYRAIVTRPGVTSTDNLNNTEVSKISDQLFAWQTDKVLDDKVRDILMADDATKPEGTQQ